MGYGRPPCDVYGSNDHSRQVRKVVGARPPRKPGLSRSGALNLGYALVFFDDGDSSSSRFITIAHNHVSLLYVFSTQIYMDEHAVRARAGLLNIVTWVAIINVWFWQEPDYVQWLFPIVAYEFITSMTVGLTPISPFGILGTLFAVAFHPEPLWKPARPKRLAWGIGFCLSFMCFMFVTFRSRFANKDVYLGLVKATVLMCNMATWFESANGFCFGCFIYNTVVVPMYKLEECSECKL